MTNLTRAALSAALTFILFGQAAMAQRAAQNAPGDMHWVATWAAAEQQPRAARLGPGPGPAPVSNVNGAVPASNAVPRPAPPPSSFQNQTVRMIVRTSLGGNRLRVHLSNAFGATPLRIGSAHVALRDMESSIVAGSDRPLTFSGATAVTIPAGAEMLSDPVDLIVPKLSDLAVSVFVPAETGPASVHSMGLHTTYISKEGDFTAAPQIADATTSQAWYWVSGVDVMAPADASTIVAFGDSITDGATSTPNTDRSWPSVLAGRLLANPATANVAIVNLGISGNRVLGDGAGVSALARFDRDVIAQAGVKWVMIMESINDIGLGARNGSITSDALIGALRQMIERAHTQGIKVIGCTLTPYVGASYASDEGEVMRTAINTFIRTPGNFDAFVDYDQVTRDPANPKQILREFNNTDHLHPNDAGYKAMADSVDLSIFASAPPAKRRK
jgi:lysophospholipase L1-like esterase